MMDTTLLYTNAYKQLERCTPLKFDCGRLCRQACCQGVEKTEGMWLFPGEEEFFFGDNAFMIRPTGRYLQNGYALQWVGCEGACRREKRPLACRIFPLTPLVKRNMIVVDVDPRAKKICPLAGGKDSLQPEFIQKVGRVCRELAKEPEIREYFDILTREIEEFCQLVRVFEG